MKIIDLLNKIANGEEVPKYINYIHRALGKDTMFVCSENIINKLDQGAIELNDEVEIIEDTPKEEKKIPEKITINENGTIGFPNGQWTARNMDKAFAMKINEIVHYLQYLKSKGE